MTTPDLPVGELLLRPLEAGDASTLEPMLNDPDRRAMFGHSAAGHSTGADWIAGQLQLQQDNATVTRHFSWAIVLRESDTVVRWTALTNINVYDGGEVEVVIDPAHRGHGYGGWVLTKVIRWAFEELVPMFTIDPHGAWTGGRLSKVTGAALLENTASIHMLNETPLADQGTSRARRLNAPRESVEVRVFSRMRDEYAQAQAATS